MSKRESLRTALGCEKPLITPLAHDALSARLIESGGFKALTIGGSAMLAARHGLPDIALIGLTDMVNGIRDIAEATRLPIMADGDDGYGDVKNVARMIAAYEILGVGGVLIEDQARDRKQQRADKPGGVVDAWIIDQKIRAAAAAKTGDMLIIGRTDSLGVLGMDEALKRADRFLKLGAEGIFIAGLKKPEDFERVGRALKGTPLLSAAMFEGSDAPWLQPAELGRMGFTQVSFPATLIFRAVAAMHKTLKDLRSYADGKGTFPPLADAAAVRGVLDANVELARWRKIEADFGGEPGAKS